MVLSNVDNTNRRTEGELIMSICYKPFVSTHKRCKKTKDEAKVTCRYCLNMLERARVKKREKESK